MLVRSFERINETTALNGLNTNDGLGIYEENPNPVLRISVDGMILYFNQGSQFLCDHWECQTGDLIPELYRDRITATLEKGKPQSFREEINGLRVVLQIVPIMGQNYVDLFGYCMPEIDTTDEKLKKRDQRANINGNRVKRQTEFARAAVHELRNPLTPILAASEMLVNRLEEGTPARLARQINASAAELNARIGELFELVQAEMGAFTLDYQPVSLGEILGEIVRFLKTGAENKGVKIIIEVDQNLPEIFVDRARFREALGYIIDNTVNRCPAKSIIGITGEVILNLLIIKIRVTCLKIPSAISMYLSSPYSIQPMDRAHFSSVGLKLTLAKLLIELHGGNIQVENENDSDTFIIRMPVGQNTLNSGGYN
jgi:signal transduction histidine kinase